MWSTYRFVLALLSFQAVASVPHSLTYLENQPPSKISDADESILHQNENNPHYEQITTVHNIDSLNESPLIQQRDHRFYHSRSLPAYMSPTPTKRESRQINDGEEDIFPRQIITNRYRTPREPTNQPLLETSPIVNERRQNIVFLNNLEAQSSNAGIRHNAPAWLPVNERQTVNVLPNIVREPVQISENPPLQIVQKPFRTTSLQDFNQHDMKKKDHDNRHIEYDGSVNVEQSNPRKIEITNGDKHIANESLAANEKYNVHTILSSPRIRDVLSTTKHRKRYLVIHPNGRVEHIDNLEPIAKDHPNHVLVNAGHINPSLYKPENINFQLPIKASNAQLKSATSNTEVFLEPQLETTLIENHDVGIDSLSGIVLTEISVTQPSSIQKVSADSVTDTKTVTKPQTSLIYEQVKSPGCNTDITGLSTSVNVSSNGEHPDLPIETLNGSSADKATATTTGEIIEVAENEQKVVGTVSEANSHIAQDIITKQNEQPVDLGKVLLKDTEIIDVNSSGKPVAWFNTSDPDYWNILTGGQETDIIYFFNVNSRPRIEKDTTRTIFPDGLVLEELIESIWYNEDDPVPVVTKKSRIIPPHES